MMQLKTISKIQDISSEVTTLLRKELHDSILSREIIPIVTKTEKNLTWSSMKWLQFMQYHLPTIKAGTYEIKAKQTLGGAASGTYTAKSQEFKVGAERYMLPPHYKHFVFPPKDDEGNYQEVLPHIIINRSTFPWERYAAITAPTVNKGNQAPWLALILLTEEDAAQIPLVYKTPAEAGFGNFVNTDTAQDKASNFSFLEINSANQTLFKNLMPKESAIPYLAHTMITKAPGKEDEEMAVLICNRFPSPGKKHIAHLVSVEKDAYNKGWPTLTGNNKKHLISLYHWSFTCEESGEMGFRQTLQQKVTIAPLRMNVGDNTLSSKVEPYLQRGYVPMPHYMRKGEKTLSWFHGPLMPMFEELPTRHVSNGTSGDDYLQKDKHSKLLDVSYAAAWQLGRNLTLKNKRVAKELYFWRKSTEQSVKQTLLNQHHFIRAANLLNTETDEIPATIKTWVKELFDLEHIPFNYLFPHPSMLPQEALRFVRLDFNWIVALIDGVLSVGMDSATLSKKTFTVEDYNNNETYKPLTGFVLRSKVVEDYPDLFYTAYSKIPGGNALAAIPAEDTFSAPQIQQKIGADIQLCLYQAPDIKMIEVFGKPRGRHFGVYKDGNVFKKRLRAYDTTNLENHGQFVQDTEFILDSNILNQRTGCLNMEQLVAKMDEKANEVANITDSIKNSSANFAFHMIEGTPKVRLWEIPNRVTSLNGITEYNNFKNNKDGWGVIFFYKKNTESNLIRTKFRTIANQYLSVTFAEVDIDKNSKIVRAASVRTKEPGILQFYKIKNPGSAIGDIKDEDTLIKWIKELLPNLSTK